MIGTRTASIGFHVVRVGKGSAVTAEDSDQLLIFYHAIGISNKQSMTRKYLGRENLAIASPLSISLLSRGARALCLSDEKLVA